MKTKRTYRQSNRKNVRIKEINNVGKLIWGRKLVLTAMKMQDEKDYEENEKKKR